MEMGRSLGHPMTILDLGGGFPANELNDQQIKTLEKTRDKPWHIIAEPGRHFSSEACALLMRVIGKR